MPSGMSLIDSTLTRSLSILIGHWSIQEVTDPAYKAVMIKISPAIEMETYSSHIFVYFQVIVFNSLVF